MRSEAYTLISSQGHSQAMPAGHANFSLRGGVDKDDFPASNISLKDIRGVGRIAWQKWGHMIADRPLRDTLGLAYAEGLYHGAMIALRDPTLRGTIGTTDGSALSSAASAAAPATNEIKTPSVRDLLESL